MSNLDVVNAFMRAAAARDYETALPLLAPDVEYQNMMLPPVHGHDAVRETVEGLLAMCGGSEWVVHHELAGGEVVMNERTDRFELNGEWLDLPVMGVFTLRDGVICRWRDYFDLQTVMTAMGA